MPSCHIDSMLECTNYQGTTTLLCNIWCNQWFVYWVTFLFLHVHACKCAQSPLCHRIVEANHLHVYYLFGKWRRISYLQLSKCIEHVVKWSQRDLMISWTIWGKVGGKGVFTFSKTQMSNVVELLRNLAPWDSWLFCRAGSRHVDFFHVLVHVNQFLVREQCRIVAMQFSKP